MDDRSNNTQVFQIAIMSTPSSSSFDEYKSEFLATTEQIKSIIQSKNVNNEVEGSAKLDDLLKQGEDLVKQMGLEARGIVDAVVKRDLLAKVRLRCASFVLFTLINTHIDCNYSNLSFRQKNTKHN